MCAFELRELPTRGFDEINRSRAKAIYPNGWNVGAHFKKFTAIQLSTPFLYIIDNFITKSTLVPYIRINILCCCKTKAGKLENTVVYVILQKQGIRQRVDVMQNFHDFLKIICREKDSVENLLPAPMRNKCSRKLKY